VEATVVLPQGAFSEFPGMDGSFDMVFQDESLNTLYVTLDIVGGTVTSAFVGVGLPGTSLDDADYFADFFRSQCLVHLTQLDAAGAQGSFVCDELENASSENPQRVDAEGTFYAVPAPPVASDSPGSSPAAPSA
jgi:hypothetical protein